MLNPKRILIVKKAEEEVRNKNVNGILNTRIERKF